MASTTTWFSAPHCGTTSVSIFSGIVPCCNVWDKATLHAPAQYSTYYLLIYEHTQTVIEDTFEFYFEEAFVPDYDNCDTAPALNCGESLT
ncbi:MAG: hypothetical protein IPP37_20975 [Saprospiraceae bacterium]|nr:hypothetical protein [Saprospiraceae bacterium]